MLETGTSVLVVHRRMFSDDQIRFFVGRIGEYDDGVACVTGFTWLRDPHTAGRYVRKPDQRTKIVSLSSGTLMVYVLETDSPPEALELVSSDSDTLFLRDGKGFEMDLSERVPA